jgi:alpha-1,2-mannosyltransferase
VITSVTLASPVAWTHHYAVLLPVFALVVPATVAAGSLGRSRFVLLGLAYVLIADNFRALNRLADTPMNFLQSYVFFGGLLLLALLYRLRSARAGDVSERLP